MIIDPDNVALVKQYILHETLLTVLERDKRAIESSSIKIKEPYLTALDEAVKKSVNAMAEIKKQMGRRGLKILNQENTEYGTEVKYLAKGYEQEAKFWGGNMRAEVWVLINKYVFGKDK